MSQNEKSPKRSANIFINYRREDSAGHAGRLFDRLGKHFPGRVFMDVDTIEPGVDFAEVIDKAVGSCEVLIVVIGRDWLTLEDASGLRRLDDPRDFVRLEVATALARGIRVIPVLVEDASMPRPEDLPPDLAKLARRNAIELSDARWTFDVDRLIQAIEAVLREKAPSAVAVLPVAPPPRKASRAWMAFAALAALAITGGIGWALGRPDTPREVNLVSSPAATVESPAVPVDLPASPEALEEQPEPTVVPEERAEPAVLSEKQPDPLEAPDVPESVPASLPEPETESYGRDTCKKGFVWREARPEDHVCVTPEVREQTREDNRLAESRRNPAGGVYGPETCLPGYVWREAFVGDHVCVTPDTSYQAHIDNGKADERRMRSVVRFTKSLLKGGRDRKG